MKMNAEKRKHIFLFFVKKMAVGVLAAAAVCTMAKTAFADTGAESPYSITITNTNGPGHIYEAYKIFSGTVGDSSEGLARIDWGEGVDSGGLLAELAGDAAMGQTFTGCQDAASVADRLADHKDDADLAGEFARCAGKHLAAVAGTSTEKTSPYTISLASPGYYLVKDRDRSLDGTTGAAYTPYLMAVAGKAELHAKETVPTVEKKVVQDSALQDAGDAGSTDHVHFQLTGTTSNYTSAYETYAYTFSDTSDKGLVADPSSVAVYHDKVSEDTRIADGYTTSYDADGHLLTVAFADVRACVSDLSSSTKLIVTYDAALTSDAEIGEKGNDNAVRVTYSNNPYGAGTGTSTEDKVTVFTFKLSLDKENEKGEALRGAGFTLYKKDGETWTAVGEEQKNVSANGFAFSDLANGIYRLKETTAPDGYEPITPVEFRIHGTYETESEDPQLTGFEVLSPDGKAFSDGQITLTIPSSGEAHMVVADRPGDALPETGGRGSDRVLLVLGLGMLAAACAVALRSRRI